MSFPSCVLMRVSALCVWAAVLLCVAAVPAVGQGDVADRIEAHRDRAGEVAVLPAEPGEAERVPSETGAVAVADGAAAADEDLAPIAEPVFAEEQLPLGPTDADAAGDGDRAGADALGRNWMMNTLAALGVVIGLIFLLRWLAKRSGLGGGVRVSASSPIVEVLSRTTVAPRSHIVLLRVGARILVVNDGTAGMRTLATVEDPDEVAGLLQSVETAKESSMSNSFGRVMSKLSNQWSTSDDAAELGNDESEAGFDRARTSLSGLRNRLRLAADSGQGEDA